MSISGAEHEEDDSRVLGVLTGQVKIPKPPAEDEEDETDG